MEVTRKLGRFGGLGSLVGHVVSLDQCIHDDGLHTIWDLTYRSSFPCHTMCMILQHITHNCTF